MTTKITIEAHPAEPNDVIVACFTSDAGVGPNVVVRNGETANFTLGAGPTLSIREANTTAWAAEPRPPSEAAPAAGDGGGGV